MKGVWIEIRFIWKNIFMKNYITTSKNFVTREIVEFIGLLTNGITDEDALDSSRSKFMFDIDSSSIG